MFVALAEEGWGEGAIAEAVARRYLAPWLGPAGPDVLVLGCTHFPALHAAIRAVVGPEIRLVDSAQPTAQAVKAQLEARGLQRPGSAPGAFSLMATDAPERFARVAPHFLGRPIGPDAVEVVDL